MVTAGPLSGTRARASSFCATRARPSPRHLPAPTSDAVRDAGNTRRPDSRRMRDDRARPWRAKRSRQALDTEAVGLSRGSFDSRRLHHQRLNKAVLRVHRLKRFQSAGSSSSCRRERQALPSRAQCVRSSWSYAVMVDAEEVHGQRRELGSAPVWQTRLPRSPWRRHSVHFSGPAPRAAPSRPSPLRSRSSSGNLIPRRGLADLHGRRLDADLRPGDVAARNRRARGASRAASPTTSCVRCRRPQQVSTSTASPAGRSTDVAGRRPLRSLERVEPLPEAHAIRFVSVERLRRLADARPGEAPRRDARVEHGRQAAHAAARRRRSAS